MPSPVWPLPICLNLWTWHSRFLCNIALYSIGHCFYHQSHLQLGVVFALALSLHAFWSSPVAYWAPTNLGSSSFSVLYLCLFILLMGFSRQEFWSGFPFPSPVDHILSELSTITHHLGWPHMAWLSFIELDKAVVHVVRLASFLWLWFQSVYPLMPSLSTCCLTGVSLPLDEGYLFTAAPAECHRCTLPWTLGISSQLLWRHAARHRSWGSMIIFNVCFQSISTITFPFLYVIFIFFHQYLLVTGHLLVVQYRFIPRFLGFFLSTIAYGIFFLNFSVHC